MAFQPKSTASAVQQLSDVENGFIYKAISNSALGHYATNDLIEVQTVTNFVAGVETTQTQYFNTTQSKVIPFADFITSDFTLVAGASAVAEAAAVKLGYFEIPSLTDGTGAQVPFTLKQGIEATGGSFPTNAAYAKVQMQRRLGTENDYLLYTQDAATVPMASPQVGQAETDWELGNMVDINDTQFLAIPAVTGGLVKLIVTLWTSNPN